MKLWISRVVLILVMLSLGSAGATAQEARGETVGQDVIGEVRESARREALEDVRTFEPRGWGFGSYAASMVFSPLLGGGVVTILGYSLPGNIEIPEERIQVLESEYGTSPTVRDAYEERYVAVYGKGKTTRQGGRALLGATLAVATNAVIIITAIALTGY